MIVGKDIPLLSMLTLAFSREGNSTNSESKNKQTNKKKLGKFQLTSGVKSQQYVSIYDYCKN